jgi:hypothetical protein
MLLQPQFVPSDALLHYKNASRHSLQLPGNPWSLSSRRYVGSNSRVPPQPSTPRRLPVGAQLFADPNIAPFQVPDQRISGRHGRTALCTQQREFYADFLKPATYKKTQTSAEIKSLMSAYEHFSYIQMKQCDRRAIEMDTVVAASSYYILVTQSRIQQTRFHYFK